MTDHIITETDKELSAIMSEICASDEHALKWFDQFKECIMFFDHVYDDDGGYPKSEIVRVMKHMIVDWGINPFYRRNSILLSTVILNCISAWEFSNLPEYPKFKSYDGYGELATTIAFMLGGHELVDKHIPRLRELVYKLYLEDELRDNYKK